MSFPFLGHDHETVNVVDLYFINAIKVEPFFCLFYFALYCFLLLILESTVLWQSVFCVLYINALKSRTCRMSFAFLGSTFM